MTKIMPLEERSIDNHIDDHVDKEIQDCFSVDAPKCFFVFAGAGSGKPEADALEAVAPETDASAVSSSVKISRRRGMSICGETIRMESGRLLSARLMRASMVISAAVPPL